VEAGQEALMARGGVMVEDTAVEMAMIIRIVRFAA